MEVFSFRKGDILVNDTVETENENYPFLKVKKLFKSKRVKK